MKEHIIIEKAKRYSVNNNNPIPEGCVYMAREGFWVEKSSNIAMVKGNNPQKPNSKKCDIETGEDQKGE